MTKEENIRAILECNFAGMKDEIIDIAVSRIMLLDQDSSENIISRKEAYEQGLNDAWEYARKIVSDPDDSGFVNNELFEIFNDVNYSRIIAMYTASEAIEKIKAWEDEQNKSCKNCGHNTGEEIHFCGAKGDCLNNAQWIPKDDTPDYFENHHECSPTCSKFDSCRYAGIKTCSQYEPKQDDTEIRVGDEVYYCDINHKRVVTSIFTVNGEKTKAVQFTESGKVAVDDVDELNKTGRHYDIESILKQMQEV